MKYLLDTNALSEPFRKRPSAALLVRIARARSELCTSVLCIGEMLFGARRIPHGAAYEEYVREVVLPSMPVLEVDLDAAVAYGELRAEAERRGQRRSDVDLLIASTALSHDLVVVTRNLRDFAGIPGLVVENWME